MQIKQKLSIAACSLLLTVSGAIHANTTIETNNQTFKYEFEPKITEFYQEQQLQGDFLIGVVNESGLIYSHAINQKIIKGQETSLNNDSPFFIASHTKAMTGTLLKILAEEGKVDLDKSLYHYLPELITDKKVDTKSISVRQLLNHTAGFTSIMHTFKTAFLGVNGGNKELIQALNTNMLTAPAGKFRYSNTGPIVAGMIVEKITGNSWQEEMRKRIFSPLMMNNTSARVSSYPLETILPSIETTPDSTVFRSGFYKKDNTMHAAGGTISTINDLAKWLRFNINQETTIIKDKDFFVELHQPTTTQQKTYFTYERSAYSLGWDIATYNGETILTRFGGYGGISFHASFMPSKKLGVIAFFNEERAYALPHLAANYLYNLIINKETADTLFEKEKQSFQKAYDNQNKRAFTKEMQIAFSPVNDELIGTYKSDSSWPDISITKSNDSYIFKWGTLDGPVLTSAASEQPFLAALGPINRSFSVQKENGLVTTLTNGSLRYIKAK